MRVLIGSSSGSGHVGPLVPVVTALLRRGDEVLAVAPAAAAEPLRSAGAEVVVVAEPPAEEVAAVWRAADASGGGRTSVLVNREIFGRLNTAARIADVEETVRRWRPDLVLHEAAEYAPAVAAHRQRIEHAQIAIGLAEVERGSLRIAAPALSAFGPDVVAAIRASAYVTQLPASLDPSRYLDTRRFRRARPDPAGTGQPPWPDGPGPWCSPASAPW